VTEWGLAAVCEAATLALKAGDDPGYVIGNLKRAIEAWERREHCTVLVGDAAERAEAILTRRLGAGHER
jgi:hypothetical protein